MVIPSTEPLETRVHEFVAWILANPGPVPTGAKVINDAIHGNQFFARHEVAVIDSPLLQRLKQIKQTGLVHQVYPTARHTRFEHTLGVATVSERIFNAIARRARLENESHVLTLLDGDVTKGDLAHVRMAALLHDVGHSLCSHASEQVYGLYSDMREFETYAPKAPGEVLSTLIICSDPFRQWFGDVVNGQCGANIDLDRVAKLILGEADEDQQFFLAQIISSPFDADKLDYIARDSFFCGLSLTVDLPRFYSTIATALHQGKRRLVLRSYVPLEQIIFSKMTLFGSVYQHQKVKCLDQMLRSTLRHIMTRPEDNTLDVRGKRVSFKDPVQYLYATDDEFFNQVTPWGDQFVEEQLRRFRHRDLPVRCLEISKRTISNWADRARMLLVQLSDNVEGLHRTEEQLFARLPERIRLQLNPGHILLSVPEPPSLNVVDAFVQSSKGSTVENIREYFPLTDWNNSYRDNKWRCYVYAPRKFQRDVRDSAVTLFSEDFDLEVRASASDRLSKID